MTEIPYIPTPLDTSNVRLPTSLAALRERLAAHCHDVWAEHRIEEGWTAGPEYSSQSKTHPCLVPFHSMPEDEQQFDRRFADETIKAIIALGFEIRPTVAEPKASVGNAP
jgi:hypothetical protein